MKNDMSITVIYHAMSLTVLYQYHITMKSDMSITVIYHAMSLTRSRPVQLSCRNNKIILNQLVWTHKDRVQSKT
jgi:hypothetical protein